MFPGPNATIVRNEDGEPIGWDDHTYDGEPDNDPYDNYDNYDYDPDEDDDEPIE
jgi:hypothetical protein